MPDVAVRDTDVAGDYALGVMDFAAAAIDEAESAILDAVYARANADVSSSSNTATACISPSHNDFIVAVATAVPGPSRPG